MAYTSVSDTYAFAWKDQLMGRRTARLLPVSYSSHLLPFYLLKANDLQDQRYP
jgi:hypothetical protein